MARLFQTESIRDRNAHFSFLKFVTIYIIDSLDKAVFDRGCDILHDIGQHRVGSSIGKCPVLILVEAGTHAAQHGIQIQISADIIRAQILHIGHNLGQRRICPLTGLTLPAS